MTTDFRILKVIVCESCGEEHNIYSYDEEGDFPCSCGLWLTHKLVEPDIDAMAKEYKDENRRDEE